MNLVLDSNALSRWVDNHPGVLAMLDVVQEAGGVVFVPTVCLVESLTGAPTDARLNQRLKGTRAMPLDVPLARDAAALRAAVHGDDAADPVVVAAAAAVGATLISDDPDIAALASHTTPPVPVV